MPTIDPYSGYGQSPDGPYENAVEVLADDNNDLPVIPGALVLNSHWETPLPVRMTLQNGNAVTLRLLPGIIHRIRPKRIHETGSSLVPEDASFTLLW
jgi:hypothetical protein